MEVEKKTRVSDGEGETIISARHQGALFTYVDRASKFTLIESLTAKKANLVTKATQKHMKELGYQTLNYS